MCRAEFIDHTVFGIRVLNILMLNEQLDWVFQILGLIFFTDFLIDSQTDL